MALYSTIGLTRALYACSLDLAEHVRRLRRRKFRVGRPKLLRPAELIQTPILIAAELSSKRAKRTAEQFQIETGVPN